MSQNDAKRVVLGLLYRKNTGMHSILAVLNDYSGPFPQRFIARA